MSNTQENISMVNSMQNYPVAIKKSKMFGTIIPIQFY